MGKFEVQVLGTSSSMPIQDRMLSSHILNVDDNLYLLDCGEGTQLQLMKFGIKRNNIKAIFISHLHGDHIFGLPGLIASYQHYQRKHPLTIIGPVGIQDFIASALDLSETDLPFALEFIELDNNDAQIIYFDQVVLVKNIPLRHRIYTNGYYFQEAQITTNIKQDIVDQYQLTFKQIKELKAGNDLLVGDVVLRSALVCETPKTPRSYAYISDTAFDSSIVEHIRNVDILYHETTYIDNMEDEAAERFHSTASQAAKIAKMANAGLLLTGHYSARYTNLALFEAQCRKVFQNTKLGKEGYIFAIKRY